MTDLGDRTTNGHENDTDRLPISVLTGFLGSGKTTVLNHLIRQPELSRTLVIVNEFGEIGLDHNLMVGSSDDVVVEMSNGCVCCTLRRDLANTLREAPWRFSRGGSPWFDRVIIETTGLADPAPILNTLMTDKSVAERYRVDGVVAAVDAANGLETLDRQIESVKQAGVADRLVITKTDLVDQDMVDRLQHRLQVMNPAAVQVTARNGAVKPAQLLNAGLYDPTTKSLNVQNWLNAEAYAALQSGGLTANEEAPAFRHSSKIRSICLTLDEPVQRDALDRWFDALSTLNGADLLRVKAILNVAGSSKPTVIHGVQHILHPPSTLEAWPSDDRRSQIVFITYDIEESDLHESIKILTGANTDQRHFLAEPFDDTVSARLEGQG